MNRQTFFDYFLSPYSDKPLLERLKSRALLITILIHYDLILSETAKINAIGRENSERIKTMAHEVEKVRAEA
jgi:hypothetical protein